MGEIIDGAIAYLEKDGGGPEEPHAHENNRLFIVVKGEAKIIFNNELVIVRENESHLVEKSTPFSIWNNLDDTTVIIGITIK